MPNFIGQHEEEVEEGRMGEGRRVEGRRGEGRTGEGMGRIGEVHLFVHMYTRIVIG